MSEFRQFAKLVKEHFDAMSKRELFAVDVERDELFELYLASFPAGTNPIYRVRTTHDGSFDRHFMRNVGHLVTIKNGQVQTLWDLKDLPAPYDVVAPILADLVRSRAIKSVFRTKERSYSIPSNVEIKADITTRYYHFHCDIASKHLSSAPDADRGRIATNLGVFKRGMEELTIDALNSVLDLINSNNLYRGQEHAAAISGFYQLKTDYDAAPNKNLFLWANIDNRWALFRNTVIGTLVTDLSAGEDLESAVRKFEAKVAPENYKRTSALITPKMIEGAVDKLKELGLESAINRRFAKISDVSVNNVLFVDNSVKPQMCDGIAGLLMDSVKPTAVSIKNAEPITMDEFLSTVVPKAEQLQVLVENKHMGNFMSVTAPAEDDAGQLFKWNNGFAWSYDGDVTDSIKERVKRAGGNIEAPLRVSLAWHNADDLDLHAKCPDGQVYFSRKLGILDVDMNGMDRHDSKAPVENLSWKRPQDGFYDISVHQYAKRRNEDGGFEVEVFANGETMTFSYPKIVNQSEQIALCSFIVRGGKVTDFKPGAKLKATSGSIDKWGVTSETLVPVDTLMASPNHWDGQAIGNKHWFFVLKGCKNPDPARGIYNEFLKSDLEPHRKVFEVLGAKTKCQPADEQLSGVGFSSTRHDSAIVVATGARINKAFHIQF